MTKTFALSRSKGHCDGFTKLGRKRDADRGSRRTTRSERLDSGDLVVKDRRVLRWNTRPNITLRQVDQYSSDGRRSAQHAGSRASRSALLCVSRWTTETSITWEAIDYFIDSTKCVISLKILRRSRMRWRESWIKPKSSMSFSYRTILLGMA